MKTTHTPGPWNVEHPYGEPGVYVSGPNTGLIARLYEVHRDYYAGDRLATSEANAQLIASAPDLLKRLNWLVSNSAYVAHSRDGESCWVMMRPDEETDFQTVSKVCHTAEEAIDSAMTGAAQP